MGNLRKENNKPDVSPSDLSYVNVVHRSTMEPIDDVQCVASPVVVILQHVARASNVLFALNLYCAYESSLDRMGLKRVAVAIFDAY